MLIAALKVHDNGTVTVDEAEGRTPEVPTDALKQHFAYNSVTKSLATSSSHVFIQIAQDSNGCGAGFLLNVSQHLPEQARLPGAVCAKGRYRDAVAASRCHRSAAWTGGSQRYHGDVMCHVAAVLVLG